MELHSNPIFKYLNPRQLREFVATCSEVELPAGAELIKQGEVSEQVFFLINGELSVRLAGPVRDQELSRLRPPAIVGEMGMLTGEPRSASVVAISSVKLLALHNSVFEERIEAGDLTFLTIVANMARVVAGRLHCLTEKMVELETEPPEQRTRELQQFRSQLFADWAT